MDQNEPQSKPSILLVEDDKDQAYLLKYFLENKGFSVRWCDSVETALALAKKIQLDLILLDIMLKEDRDGFELCQIIKSDPSLKNIPVIMVTARTSVQDKINGLELGADDYVTKPFRRDELVARIQATLRRKEYSESNARYRELMENTKDVVIFLDLYARIEQVNKRAEHILPQLKSGFIGVKIQEFFDKQIEHEVLATLRKALNGEEWEK